MMKARTMVLAVGVLSIALGAVDAAAVPPTLHYVDEAGRRPTAAFTAPRAGSATIYIASNPSRATNGRFFDEHVETSAFLTSSEIQGGSWVDDSKIDPGSYWVMLNASPDFGGCYIFDAGGFDPACADGFSTVLPLHVPEPPLSFATSATVYSFLGQVDVRLTARPLGKNVRYRVCYRNVKRVRRCLAGVLDGFSWDYPASDTLSVRSRNLPRLTTFTWHVGGRQVASRRVRVR